MKKSKIQSNKLKSKWSLKVLVEKCKDCSCLKVTLKTEPIENITEYLNEWMEANHETHPFDALLHEQRRINKASGHDELKEIDWPDTYYKTGEYSEFVKNSTVARSIINTLKSPKKIKESAGHTDWQWHRATLIKMLDMLWD